MIARKQDASDISKTHSTIPRLPDVHRILFPGISSRHYLDVTDDKQPTAVVRAANAGDTIRLWAGNYG